MKCVIFAGGKGNRIKTENNHTPKPLIRIGDEPIIWHIMKSYSYYGVKDFIICLGYEQLEFKKYFIDLMNKNQDIHLDFKNKKINSLSNCNEDWNIILVDTGLETLTGARLKQIEKYLDEKDESFFLTYADAVSDVNIKELYNFHKKSNKLVTITVVKKKERFGVVELDDLIVKKFKEKNIKNDEWINAGFMVVNKKVLSYLDEKSTTFEKEILEKLTEENELVAYKHNGFWQCMDYQNERELLDNLLKRGEAKWKVWDK